MLLSFSEQPDSAELTMRSSLIIPRKWMRCESAADLQDGLDDRAQRASCDYSAATLHDYTNFSVFNHESGVIVSALPTFERMAAKAKSWMPKPLEVMECCDIDPLLYPRILHISSKDWHVWQQGKLETVSLYTVVSGSLLWEILSFLLCNLGSWEIVSQLLNKEACLQRLSNKCPLHMIKSGDIRELARLHHFLAGEVMGSPFL